MAEPTRISVDLSGTFIGRFHVRSKLGAGGMGEVYLAEDTQLKRLVALKRIAPRWSADQDFRQRFLHEARIASSLNDSHIAGIYDVLERDRDIFLVMEYVQGKSLRQFLNAPIEADRFLPIAIECARGLAAAHAHGVLHRDIKPENIMITASGHVKILDFGLARRLDHLEETVSYHTGQGVQVGTAGYVAPEVVQDADPSTRSDIFALGVVFYEALSGRHPFRGKTSLTTAHRVVNTIPPPLGAANPSVSRELDGVIARMLAKDPAQRFSDATGLANELCRIARAISAGHGVEPAVRPLKRSWLVPRRKRVLAVSLLALMLAGTAAVRPVRKTVEGWMGFGQLQGRKQVAVLPFSVMGADASRKAFAAGLTAVVTARLGELSAEHNLEVVPASEVFGKKVTTPDLARKEFGANLVLTGSLQQAGNRVRVTCSLIDTGSQRQLAARTITVAAADPFAVEDVVSMGSLDMLQVQLDSGEKKKIERHGTTKPDAYAFYLRGKGYLENYDRPENIANAIAEFRHALDQDPHYARAFAGLGQAYWERYRDTHDGKWVKASTQACQKAAALDSKLAAAMTCLGTVDEGTGHYREAAEQFREALKTNDGDDRAYIGLAKAYTNLGKTDEAEQTYLKAIRRHPQYWALYNWLGTLYVKEGRYADARRMFRQAIALVPDNQRAYYNLGAVYAWEGNLSKAAPLLRHSVAILGTGEGYSNLGTIYFFLHKYEKAIHSFRRALVLEPNSYRNWRNLGDGYYWTPGKRKQAAAAYRKAIQLAREALKVNPHEAGPYGCLAICEAMLGRKEAALQALKQAESYAKGDPEISYDAALVHARNGNRKSAMNSLKQALSGGYNSVIARNDPALDSLHGMEGFPGPEKSSDNNKRRD